jgi:endonuclease G
MFTLDSLRTDAFSWKAALSLASASKLSYEHEVAVQNVVRNSWGFAKCDFLDVGDTQGFVAQTSDIVLVAFRGSESLGDWLGNLNLLSTQRPYGSVHRGFFLGFELVHAKITQALSQGATGTKRIWLTGHSLGGALATIAAAELRETVAITGIHTCGQPRIGNSQFKEFMRAHFGDRFFRFVNDDDIVPQVPPGYEHVGNLIHFDSHGTVERANSDAESAAIEPPALTEEEFRQMQEEIKHIQAALAQAGGGQEAVLDASVEGLFPSLSDHSLDRYIAIIRRHADVQSHDAAIGAELVMRSALESVGAAESVTGRRTTDAMPVLLRVKDPNWRAPKGAKINSRFGNIVSAQVPSEVLLLLQRDPGVTSIEASREAGVLDLATSLPFVGGDQVHRPPLQEKGDSALVGIIDTGVDVLHEAFRDAQGNTRILAYWDQADSLGPTPKAVDAAFDQDYGTLYLAAEIDRFIAGTRVTPQALRDPGAHGTHVASIAAGRGVGQLSEWMAPEARIIVVSPYMKTSPNDPPSLGYSNAHVDALHFLKIAAGGGNAVLVDALPIAVNVSLGMNAGAHDGSSTLEAAFDLITDAGRDPGYVIVKSAGNERGLGGRARVRAFNGLVNLQWDATAGAIRRPQDYIEVWYSSLDDIEFTLVDPAGNRAGPVSRANPVVTQVLNENTCDLRLTDLHPDNGDSRLTITIAPRQSSIQSNRWTLEIVGTSIQSGTGLLDAWIERDNAREVRFVNDEPEATLSVPGTAKSVVTVGACHSAAPLQLTPTSSFGRTRDGRAKPDICAPGNNIIAARAGRADHQAVRPDTGTSMAAPHVTGALALVLSRRQKRVGTRQYNAQQLRAGLIRSTRNLSRVHHEGFGFGLLDVVNLLNTLP